MKHWKNRALVLTAILAASPAVGCMQFEEGAEGEIEISTHANDWRKEVIYQVLVDRRDEVMVALNARGIYPGVHYRDNTLYRMYAEADGTCPRARRASESVISLPLHLRLEDDDVRRVAAALAEASAAIA